MSVILNLLKDPKVLGIIFLIGYILYQFTNILSLESTINKKDSIILLLRNNNNTLNLNVRACKHVNNSNNYVIKDMKRDSIVLKGFYNKSLVLKDKLILTLRNDIKELKKPVQYPETIVYKECKVKIKTKVEDEDSTFNIISNIGN